MARQADIENRIALFTAELTKLFTENSIKHPRAVTFLVEYGTKYARIVKEWNPDDRSVYCFIDLSNGEILKAESWKKPAAGSRGSIWAEDCDVGQNKPCDILGWNLYSDSQVQQNRGAAQSK